MNLLRYLMGERRGMGSELKPPTRAQWFGALAYPSISIPNEILIVDCSFYQGKIDFAKMKAAGIRGVVIRAGQRSWVDPMFVTNWQAAKVAGLLRGSYWFWDSRETPEKQAGLWWGLLRDDTGELPHVPDLEESYGGAYASKAYIKTFFNEFQRLSALPDKRVVTYSGFYWLGERIGNDTFFSRYRLWLAWYSPEEVVRVPLPWTESGLILWQYTSAGDGIKYGVESKEIDLNWYNGTLSQFVTDFGGAVEPPPNGGTMNYYQATGSILIKDAPAGVGVKLAGVTQYVLGPMSGNGAYSGDILETEAPVNGIVKIVRLWRNGAWTQLPPAAYVGITYLKPVAFTPPPDPVLNEPKVISTFATLSNTYIYDDGTQVTVKAENVELK